MSDRFYRENGNTYIETAGVKSMDIGEAGSDRRRTFTEPLERIAKTCAHLQEIETRLYRLGGSLGAEIGMEEASDHEAGPAGDSILDRLEWLQRMIDERARRIQIALERAERLL